MATSIKTTQSANGALLKVGSTASLATSTGIWTLKKSSSESGYQILLNGKSAAAGLGTMLEVAGGTMYAKNSYGHWYKWTGGDWLRSSNPNVLKLTARSLTVAKGAAATPIKIAAPTDSIYSGAQLKVAVTAVPTDGSVMLSGGAAVTKGQALTVTQLTGLVFKATSALASGNSTFNYS